MAVSNFSIEKVFCLLAVEETQLIFSLHHSAVTVYLVEEHGQQVGHEHRHQAGHADER